MNNKTEEVIEKMTKIALEKVKHYFTDFTKFDIPMLVESGGINYIWLIRDTGTWIVNINSQEKINCHLLESMIGYSDEVYWINLEEGTVKQRKLDFYFLKSEIEKFEKEKEVAKNG